MDFQLTLKSRWPEDLTVKFVELYKRFECLWNIHNPEYKNKSLKRLAYENIAANINIEGFGINDVRQKVRNLRCTYQQELSKIEKSKTREDGTPLHVPSIKWFSSMHELMCIIRNNTGESFSRNQVKLETRFIEEPSDEFEEYYEYLDDDITFEDTILKEEEDTSIQQEEIPSNLQVPVPKEINIRSEGIQRSNSNANNSFISYGSRKRKLPDNSLNDEVHPVRKNSKLGDECGVFGKYIGMNLSKLPLELSIRAQLEIHETITRYRLLAMKSSSSTNEAGPRNSDPTQTIVN